MWLRIYAATRFPFVPIYGGFPVKLTTYVGKPISYDENLSPEELQIKVINAITKILQFYFILNKINDNNMWEGINIISVLGC